MPGPGIINTVAGMNPGNGGCNGTAKGCDIGIIYGVALDNSGNVYIAGQFAELLWKVTASTGAIQVIAGNENASGYVDGIPATQSNVTPYGVKVDSQGNVFISDNGANRIRMICANTTSPIHGTTCPAAGDIITIAGNRTYGFSGDGGPATSAELYNPYGLALDSADNIYFVDSGNNRIRKVTASTGYISTVAGTGTGGYTGDGGLATSAELWGPMDLAMDPLSNLYIADFNNSVIRKVTASTGIISTVAGNGTPGYVGDGGPATAAELNYPLGIASDAVGNLFITDYYSDRIREVSAATGIITTVAGDGTGGYSGDGGQATSAEIGRSYGMALDSAGNLFFSDSRNYVVRAVGTAPVRFSLSSGTYTGSQTVSLSCTPSSGTSIWYTTNGYPANTAATLYTGPITVSASETIHAICAYTGVTDINSQTSRTGWKCNAPPGNTQENPNWVCNTNSNNGTSGSLSWWDFQTGSTAYLEASTTNSSPTNAILFIHEAPTTCDGCTTITQHLVIEPDQGTSVITRNEMDMEHCCDTTTGALHQASLQCNGSVWEINASGSWFPTTIACNLPTSSHTDVVYEAHWIKGDTAGCGKGTGCMYIDSLTVNGTKYSPMSNYCSSNPLYAQCGAFAMTTHATWKHFGAGNQHQIGLNGTTGCGANPCTGGRHIYTNNVTTTMGSIGIASATYTIH
ncbi:chitobiase/beta-hexosaminidase C-terminal domain-containing protein [Occallatibacter riparius]|uniref:Chitobiase/beta-hexosaminidase C-terminal domain-containing protein n=1 Tax=Occallatibacter riparius TaxID=1002689 RepID=A0A9J7BH48_9BACT|nr:chitobiase/beta-hexosaminidase C-terminal domain-containing protein [Occallatibacter riparius]UWZ82300.1 chitobiase/beta-hexosaminidase C-terminal domain-containing protein [Occallatibacter riparius]